MTQTNQFSKGFSALQTTALRHCSAVVSKERQLSLNLILQDPPPAKVKDDKGKMDLCKAFDTVPHAILVSKLERHGFDG